jgi:dnd system-associated protein 4
MDASENERGDRINIDDAVMDIYRELTDNESKEQAPFSTYRDLFLLAACVGLQNNQRTPLSAGRKTTIRKEVFGDEGLAILKAIAIASTGDVVVLSNLGDVLTIAEEYANSGIHEIKASLLDERGRPLWNLVRLNSSTICLVN